MPISEQQDGPRELCESHDSDSVLVLELPVHSTLYSVFFFSFGVVVILYGLALIFYGLALSTTTDSRGNLHNSTISSTPLNSPSKTTDQQKGLLILIRCMYIGLSRRLRAKSAREIISSDIRSPIVYLRSFIADKTDQPNQFLIYSENFFPFTKESGMVRQLRTIGPVVAIGRPVEHLPPLGAARIYVGGTDWRAVVGDLLDAARFVVIQAGGLTRGIEWEMRRVRCELPSEKVVLWFPQAMRK
jgi:hypothetical protein